MYCWGRGGCKNGTFSAAAVPVWGESNVGFTQTYANLLLQTLPANEGVVIINTGACVGAVHTIPTRARPHNTPDS